MSWRTYHLGSDLGEWSGLWDELNRELYGGHPLYDSRFTSALLRHFGHGNEYLAVHRGAGQPDGMLILAPYRKGCYTTFRPAQAQVCPVLVKSADMLPELFAEAGKGVLAFDLLCQDSAYTPLINSGDGGSISSMRHALTMNIALEGEFDAYWNTRSRNLRRNMRRYWNRIERELGNEQLVETTDAGAMADAVGRYSALEATGWKAREGTAVVDNDAQGAFYKEVLEVFANTGQATVYEHVVNDKVIASRLMICNRHLIIVLKTAYDENFSRFAPGRRLLYLILQREFAENGEKCLEFYTNASADQLSWATGTREIRHFTVYRNPMVRMGHHVLRAGRRALATVRGGRR